MVAAQAPLAAAAEATAARAMSPQASAADVADDVSNDEDASFDALANEIDALLGRIAGGDNGARGGAGEALPGRRG